MAAGGVGVGKVEQKSDSVLGETDTLHRLFMKAIGLLGLKKNLIKTN